MAVFRDDLALQAAERWREVPAAPQPLEELLVAHGENADLRDQRQKRIARLGEIASTAKAQALALAAKENPKASGSQEDVLNSVGVERIIGNRDLLGVDFLELAIAISRAIGRMRCGDVFATGVLIGPRLLITNNHVINDSNRDDGWLIEMDYQQNASGDLMQVHRYKVDPQFFFCTSKALDYTIIGIDELSDKHRPISAYPWAKLVAALGKIEVGDPINIIQHPQGGLKQIAFRKNEVIALTTAKPDFLDYTTDTEEGSSGSGCFNDQWELVALHHSGVPRINGTNIMTTQGQVWHKGDDPKDIAWIGNEGVRVSAIIRDLSSTVLPPAFAPLVKTMLNQDPPNPIELARMTLDGNNSSQSSPAPDPAIVSRPQPISIIGGNNMSSGAVSFRVPLTITVSLDGSPQTPSSGLVSTSPSALQSALPQIPLTLPSVPGEEAVVIDQDWKGRPGYLPDFLGEHELVPLPTLTGEQLDLTAKVDLEFQSEESQYPKNELRYWNYSVLMNKKYRTAWFSAANVDGDERFQMPPRKGDKWFQDKRIPLDEQLDQSAFEPGIDRGHLTRREDAAWGKSQDIAVKSTNDTFHFTNCSLQASPFNRGKDRWQGLEQFLLEQHAKKDKRRIVVITGPVFDPKNPTYRNDKMDYTVPCPLQFWKVCVIIRPDDSMSATGFLLGQQDIAQLPGFESFDVGAAQVTLKQLQTKTKLTFDKTLLDADNFAKTGDVGALEQFVEGEKHRVLRNFNDIVV